MLAIWRVAAMVPPAATINREGAVADVEQLLWMAIYLGLALMALGLTVMMIRKRR